MAACQSLLRVLHTLIWRSRLMSYYNIEDGREILRGGGGDKDLQRPHLLPARRFFGLASFNAPCELM